MATCSSRTGPGLQAGRLTHQDKRLHLEEGSGNLVLVDAKNQTKWQSFDHPTNVMLRGQLLNVAARLTTFPANFSVFYSLEIQQDKIVVYLNWRDNKYTYWEYKPSSRKKIAFSRLDARGLKLFDKNSCKIGQILAGGSGPVRFLALGSEGNLELYDYSSTGREFISSYEALGFCDLPLPCGLYVICSSTNSCRQIKLPGRTDGIAASFDRGIYNGFCKTFGSAVEMVELVGVNAVLRASWATLNVSEEDCVASCLQNCHCAAVLYSENSGIATQRECFHYGLVAVAREGGGGAGGYKYWVKIPKEESGGHGISSGVPTMVLIIGGVIDAAAVLVITAALVYYCFRVQRGTAISATQNG